jgi:hypothetical protein
LTYLELFNASARALHEHKTKITRPSRQCLTQYVLEGKRSRGSGSGEVVGVRFGWGFEQKNMILLNEALILSEDDCFTVTRNLFN